MINCLKRFDKRKILLIIAYTLLLTASVFLFIYRAYAALCVLIALAVCLPFLALIESGKYTAKEVVTLAVMTASAVVGRLLFAPIPGFKPVSAITVICGAAFGPLPAFTVGALSAVISNIFYGQGPWTPFQMLMWGLIGFFSGLIFMKGKRPSKIILLLYGALGGFIFSAGMDIWTTVATEGAFSFERYLFYMAAALPTTVCYAVSNVIFLLLLTDIILKKTERLRLKYGVFA